jgi:hypothetical protein
LKLDVPAGFFFLWRSWEAAGLQLLILEDIH